MLLIYSVKVNALVISFMIKLKYERNIILHYFFILVSHLIIVRMFILFSGMIWVRKDKESPLSITHLIFTLNL